MRASQRMHGASIDSIASMDLDLRGRSARLGKEDPPPRVSRRDEDEQ